RLAELCATLDRLRSRRDGLQAEYDSCAAEEMRLRSKIDDEPAQTASLREKAALAEERLDRIRQEIFDTNAKIASLRENYNFYVGLKNRFDGYKFSVKKLMGETRTDAEIARMVKGVIADIVTTEEKYEVAIETAFGGAMQNVVTATADDARRLIEHLKKTGGGIVTFLPVESMKPHFSSREIASALRETGAMGLAVDLVTYDPYYDNVIKNLLGNTLVCDNIYHATAIAKKYRSAFRIVTLDGDVVATSGAMTGGSKRQESGNLLANERKIKECEDAIEEKKGYLAKLEEMRLRGEKIKAENDAALQSLRSQFEEARTALATLLQKEETLAASLAETNESLTETAAAEGELRQKASAIESEYTLSAEDEEALSLKRAESEKLLARQQEQYALVKAEYDTKSARAGELRVEIAALRSAIEAESSSKERLLSEKESLVQELADTRKNIAGIETTISELDREAERKALTPGEQAEVDALRSEIASVADRKRVLNARNVLMDSNKSELTAKIASLQDQKFNCDLSLSKIDASLAAAEVRIAEEYELDYEGCLAYRVDGFELEGSGAKINSLKRKISALGAVNPNAIEDYEQLRIRYEEMQIQQTDLEKGISDLKTVLEQIKGEMKRQFDQGFQTISENFKTTYRELFGGGRAELQMIYEEGTDPLDAGVEIFACPPGKKLTKISLLSGGERALTAIAILFAILKLRPMPFCILDEIEAALDEANVDRFAQYLKNFSKETQFIVITHRKPTMEQADSLFGVTMEEKGVSKIVSVRLSDLEAKLGSGTFESS
ncbi:MAG: chromosome segregation protein SMC, partial [Christensenellaceae bacterium]